MADVQTPGANRVFEFQVNGSSFGFRRPSVADIADITRRFASKLTVTGVPIESEYVNQYAGNQLLWEARLEVCLKPRRRRDSSEIALGERAPDHWKDGELIDFSTVDRAEFDEVCARVTPLFAPPPAPEKKTPEPPTGSLPDPTSD